MGEHKLSACAICGYAIKKIDDKWSHVLFNRESVTNPHNPMPWVNLPDYIIYNKAHPENRRPRPPKPT